jgi:hypothetical protein
MSYIDGVHQIVIVIAEIPAVVLTIHHLSVIILIVLSLLQQQQHEVSVTAADLIINHLDIGISVS